jgi:hypothetical protein
LPWSAQGLFCPFFTQSHSPTKNNNGSLKNSSLSYYSTSHLGNKIVSFSHGLFFQFLSISSHWLGVGSLLPLLLGSHDHLPCDFPI